MIELKFGLLFVLIDVFQLAQTLTASNRKSVRETTKISNTRVCVCVCPSVYDLNVTHELFNEMIFYYYDCRTAYADCV